MPKRKRPAAAAGEDEDYEDDADYDDEEDDDDEDEDEADIGGGAKSKPKPKAGDSLDLPIDKPSKIDRWEGFEEDGDLGGAQECPICNWIFPAPKKKSDLRAMFRVQSCAQVCDFGKPPAHLKPGKDGWLKGQKPGSRRKAVDEEEEEEDEGAAAADGGAKGEPTDEEIEKRQKDIEEKTGRPCRRGVALRELKEEAEARALKARFERGRKSGGEDEPPKKRGRKSVDKKEKGSGDKKEKGSGDKKEKGSGDKKGKGSGEKKDKKEKGKKGEAAAAAAPAAGSAPVPAKFKEEDIDDDEEIPPPDAEDVKPELADGAVKAEPDLGAVEADSEVKLEPEGAAEGGMEAPDDEDEPACEEDVDTVSITVVVVSKDPHCASGEFNVPTKGGVSGLLDMLSKKWGVNAADLSAISKGKKCGPGTALGNDFPDDRKIYLVHAQPKKADDDDEEEPKKAAPADEEEEEPPVQRKLMADDADDADDADADDDDATQIEMEVRGVNGKAAQKVEKFVVDPKKGLAGLRDKIEKEWGVESASQRLILKGRQLEELPQENSQVNLVVKPDVDEKPKEKPAAAVPAAAEPSAKKRKKQQAPPAAGGEAADADKKKDGQKESDDDKEKRVRAEVSRRLADKIEKGCPGSDPAQCVAKGQEVEERVWQQKGAKLAGDYRRRIKEVFGEFERQGSSIAQDLISGTVSSDDVAGKPFAP